MKQRDFRDWGLTVVRDPKLADLHLEVDRPLWTYTFTVVVQDSRTSMLLASYEVIAASGDLAAPTLAEKIVKMIGAARSPRPPSPTRINVTLGSRAANAQLVNDAIMRNSFTFCAAPHAFVACFCSAAL